MKKTAIILGSTGLIGNLLLLKLLKDDTYERVIVFVRKKTNFTHQKLTQEIIDFNNTDSYKNLVKGDVIYCCLGSTIKKAGSEEAFKKVDYQYPLEFAIAGKENGVNQYMLVSSIGATVKTANFYLKTKGEIEKELSSLNFESLILLRPSMLLGKRNEFRFLELLGKVFMTIISFMFIGPLKNYKAIQAYKVADMMIKQAILFPKGIIKINSGKIQ
jgi:uncharacterized protein YbjT (DUF2867 family)